MTREQFKVLVKAMKAVYANPGFIPDQDAFDVWYSMLKDLDYAIASRAVQMHLQTEETPPTVAGIRKQFAKLKADEADDLNETAAWSLALKAIHRSTYYSDEEFCKLPKIVQRVIGNPSRLREMAMDENFNHGVESSNLIKQFRIEKQREREREKLSPDILRLMRPINNPQIEKNATGLSIEDQRLNEEKQSVSAPPDFRAQVEAELKLKNRR